MVSAFLIPFRETLEATLILGIILAYLHKTDNRHLNGHVLGGAALAVLASVVTAVLFNQVAGGFTGNTEKIFEGITMLAAAAILTYVIFWMATQTQFTQRIEHKVNQHVSTGKNIGLAAMSFFAVYREGVETVLFMGATLFAAEGNASLLLAGLGVGSAIVIGFLVFKTALRFQLKTIFSATSILLILFAAGLTAHGVHEFQEVGLLPTPYGKVWNTNGFLDEKSTMGTFAKALFGYNGDPFELEAFSYFAYIGIVALAYRTWVRPAQAANAPAKKTPQRGRKK
ncbi:FTR1 family protein [Candidatus Micrarchaeota archaeon]|nr:FTR1 family protein [Candidatus Micrarchaeota archaeon]